MRDCWRYLEEGGLVALGWPWWLCGGGGWGTGVLTTTGGGGLRGGGWLGLV